MGTCQDWEYFVYVLVPRTESRANQDQLDAYISVTGALSIPAALRASKTLGLTGIDTSLIRMSVYGGSFPAAAVPHIGARLHVRVLVTN